MYCAGPANPPVLQAIAMELCYAMKIMIGHWWDTSPPPAGGVLPYIGYIGMCGPKEYGFSAVLVINRVSILANFGHFGHK